MKVADGPVTLEINGHGEDEGYLRWRDYHHSYPSGQRVVYVHQLSKIADGADPEKVFSNGAYEVNHTGDVVEIEGRDEVGDGHRVKELNGWDNLELVSHVAHWNHHVNGQETEPADADDDPAQHARRGLLVESIRALENGEGAPVDRVIDMAVEANGADRETIEHDLEEMRLKGEVYEPATGRLRAI